MKLNLNVGFQFTSSKVWLFMCVTPWLSASLKVASWHRFTTKVKMNAYSYIPKRLTWCRAFVISFLWCISYRYTFKTESMKINMFIYVLECHGCWLYRNTQTQNLTLSGLKCIISANGTWLEGRVKQKTIFNPK